MSMKEKDDSGLESAKTVLRKMIAKTVMDDGRYKPVVEELGDGAGVFATHKITFQDHELFARSEKDAKFAEAAITALNLAMAAEFACDLTGAVRA